MNATALVRLVLPLAVLLAGCALGSPRGPAVEEIVVEARPDANRNSAVAVDVALALAPAVAEQLKALPAAEWFRRREQLKRDYPDGLKVLSWELVPGQSVHTATSGPYLDGYVFAGYATAGDHRARLTLDSRRVRVVLEANGFVLDEPEATR